MDKKLLEILVCPVCKSDLIYKKEEQELICKADRLAYPIRDGIPVMLEGEARHRYQVKAFQIAVPVEFSLGICKTTETFFTVGLSK